MATQTAQLVEDNAGGRYIVVDEREGWGGLEAFGLDEQGVALRAAADGDTSNFSGLDHYVPDRNCLCGGNEHYHLADLLNTLPHMTVIATV